MSTILCARCGIPMTTHGAVASDDEFICDRCHEEVSRPVHDALAANAVDLAALAAEAMEQPKRSTMEARKGLWDRDGMFLQTLSVADDGQHYSSTVELIEGDNAEDALKKTMAKVKIFERDPRVVRIVTGMVLQEMRREAPGEIIVPGNRLNGRS